MKYDIKRAESERIQSLSHTQSNKQCLVELIQTFSCQWLCFGDVRLESPGIVAFPQSATIQIMMLVTHMT